MQSNLRQLTTRQSNKLALGPAKCRGAGARCRLKEAGGLVLELNLRPVGFLCSRKEREEES